MSALPTESELLSYLDTLSNWGRWGPEDELGTLNLITPEKRVQAAQLVTDGRGVSLCGDLDPAQPDPLDRGSILQRFMIYTGEGNVPIFDGPTRFQAAREYLGLVPHGSNTHLDALSHIMWDGQMYNGFPASAVTTPSGATKLSVHHAKEGIITKGVLLDVAAARGVPWLAPGEGVYPEDLDAAEARQGVVVGPGDALFVHTGNLARNREEGLDHEHRSSGFTAGCLPWFRERDVAVVGSDSINDVQPSGYEAADLFLPVHVVGLVGMGLWLIDNAELAELAEVCAELSRWEFMLAMPSLRVVGSTSSPVNPVALF